MPEAEQRRDLCGILIDGRYRLITKYEDRTHPVLERYEAEQVGLSRLVEVEILRVVNGEGVALEERFKRNAEMMARFDHPNITPIFDGGTYQGCPFVVRPASEGRTLESYLNEPQLNWSIEQVSTVLADIADALHALHEVGLVARRLALSEVIVSADGRGRIVELRSAQESSAEADARGDLAALGTIGRQLVPGEGPRMIDPARARLLGLLDRLCAEDPSRRPASAELVAHALRAISRRSDASESDTMLEGLRPAVLAMEEQALVQEAPSNKTLEADINSAEAPVVEAQASEEAWKLAQSIEESASSEPPEVDVQTDVVRAREPSIATPAKEESLLDLSVVKSRWHVAFDRAVSAVQPHIADPKRRAIGVAVVAGGLLLAVAIGIAARSPGDPTQPITSAPRVTKSSADLAASARERTNRGDTTSAIDELERALVEENRYGDAALHAALAHAYVRANRGSESLQHFAIAIRTDPSALQDTDITELVGQLALPKKEGDRAADLTVELGQRAIPALSDVSTDEGSDKQMRARSQKALRTLASRSTLLPRKRTDLITQSR